jgi:predicted transcriptional regulator
MLRAPEWRARIVDPSRAMQAESSPVLREDLPRRQPARDLRRERGRTLVQVAAASGLSQPFLSQLELGRSRPSMRSLFRIAEAQKRQA